MRFSIEVHDQEFPILLEQLIHITGREPWIKRFAWLEREMHENNFMADWLLERCSIEWALKDVLRTQPLTPTNPFRIENVAHYELIAFMAGITRCFGNLGDAGKRRLRGVLIDGLKSDKGLSSVQHEIATAVHLMTRGFDVEFHDIEHGGGVDFIARKDGIEVEIECKMFSADLGRKIHRRRSTMLFKMLENATEPAYKAAARGLIVRVVIPDRLTPSPLQHRNISQTLLTALVSGTARTTSEDCFVEVTDFAVVDSPFNVVNENQLSRSEVAKFVAFRIGRENTSLMSQFSACRRAVVISLESEKPDGVLDGMRRQLRDAAIGQFTKTRPAFLAVQLHDLSEDQLRELAHTDSSVREHASRLQIMTSDLLQSASRTHVHTIVYRSHNNLASPFQGSIGADGVAYLIKNRNHPLVDDARYGIFGNPLRSDGRIVLPQMIRT